MKSVKKKQRTARRIGTQQEPRSRDEMRRVHAQRRRKKRKRTAKIIAIVFLLILILTLGILSLTVLFPIEAITVPDYPEEQRYTQQEIIDNTGIALESNLFIADTKSAAVNIQKALPYIGEVKIKRKLPSTITISVEYTQPIGYLQTGEAYTLINEYGKVLDMGMEKQPKDFAKIEIGTLTKMELGSIIETEDSQIMNQLVDFLTMVSKAELQGLTEINLTDLNHITAVYQNRITLIIGDTQSLEDKLVLGKKSLEEEDKLQKNSQGELNLTFKDKAYFTPKSA